MEKVISFGVWGNKPMYDVGLLANIEQAKTFYPGWTLWIFVPLDYALIPQMLSPHVRVFEVPPNSNHYLNNQWRLLPYFNPKVEVLLCRDADSRFSDREVEAVNQFIESEMTVHYIKDHRRHQHMLAGTLGVKKDGFYTDYRNDFVTYFNSEAALHFGYGVEENFLRNIVYPKCCNRVLGHSFSPKPGEKWLSELDNPQNFIGNKYNENHQPLVLNRYV